MLLVLENKEQKKNLNMVLHIISKSEYIHSLNPDSINVLEPLGTCSYISKVVFSSYSYKETFY